jgi:hypothetical protein
MDTYEMSTLNPESMTLRPLPHDLSSGLVAVSIFGFLSFFFSFSLFLFLTWRLWSWRRQGRRASTNQFFVLIYNLVLADIQQALAFLLNVSALRKDALEVGTRTCWAQGWFVSTGDLASSVFIFAIALHTFLGVVKGYKLPSLVFYGTIGLLWVFIYIMAFAGVMMHPDDIFVRAGAWVCPTIVLPQYPAFTRDQTQLMSKQCWINTNYQNERLWLHYFWIFFAMFGTIVIYSLIFIFLRHRSRSPSSSSNPIPHGATPLMILYPAIYTICTVPLAAGRIASMAGRQVDNTYFCIAGSMIACNGWLDVLLYSLTRRSIVFSDSAPGDDFGIGTFWGIEKRTGIGTVTTIEAGAKLGRTSSTENLYGGDGAGMGIKVGTTVNVRSEVDVRNETFEMRRSQNGSLKRHMESRDTGDGAGWVSSREEL